MIATGAKWPAQFTSRPPAAPLRWPSSPAVPAPLRSRSRRSPAMIAPLRRRQFVPSLPRPGLALERRPQHRWRFLFALHRLHQPFRHLFRPFHPRFRALRLHPHTCQSPAASTGSSPRTISAVRGRLRAASSSAGITVGRSSRSGSSVIRTFAPTLAFAPASASSSSPAASVPRRAGRQTAKFLNANPSISPLTRFPRRTGQAVATSNGIRAITHRSAVPSGSSSAVNVLAVLPSIAPPAFLSTPWIRCPTSCL